MAIKREQSTIFDAAVDILCQSQNLQLSHALHFKRRPLSPIRKVKPFTIAGLGGIWLGGGESLEMDLITPGEEGRGAAIAVNAHLATDMHIYQISDVETLDYHVQMYFSDATHVSYFHTSILGELNEMSEDKFDY